MHELLKTESRPTHAHTHAWKFTIIQLRTYKIDCLCLSKNLYDIFHIYAKD